MPPVRVMYDLAFVVRYEVRSQSASIFQVSSFETVAENGKGKEEFFLPQMPKGCDFKDFARWRNCMHRDFTVNRYQHFIRDLG